MEFLYVLGGQSYIIPFDGDLYKHQVSFFLRISVTSSSIPFLSFFLRNYYISILLQKNLPSVPIFHPCLIKSPYRLLGKMPKFFPSNFSPKKIPSNFPFPRRFQHFSKAPGHPSQLATRHLQQQQLLPRGQHQLPPRRPDLLQPRHAEPPGCGDGGHGAVGGAGDLKNGPFWRWRWGPR